MAQSATGSSMIKNLFLALAPLCALYAWTRLFREGSVEQTTTPDLWQWSDIDPATELRYHSCWRHFQCARLRLPMDWNDTRENDYVDIAILRLPARVPVTDARYGGAVIINPGGPGYSGVRYGITQAPAAQVIFDAADENSGEDRVSELPTARYYDILAFDPRGLNNSTPYFTCHATSSAEVEWAIQGNDAVLGTPETDTLTMLARAEARGKGCGYSTSNNRTGSKITAFMSTAMVARDIVAIAERHGEWREKQAKDANAEVIERLRWRRGEEQINFWGLSYGSVLGMTVATMQPHRVRRFLLDGVNDPEDYYSGLWERNLLDADQAFHRLFQDCADAGREACPLWAGPSGSDTEGLLKSILDDVEKQGPVAVPGNEIHGPQVITLSDIKTFLAASIMLPRKYWPLVAALLEPLLRRDGSLFGSMKAQIRPIFQASTGEFSETDRIDPRDLTTHTHAWALGRPGAAVRCLDSHFKRNLTQFFTYWEMLRYQSFWLGDILATQISDCYGWSAESPWLFADETPIASTATANPIFFASSALDPITPIAGAKIMQRRFPGSGLLQVDGAGHTTVSLVNLCAGQAYRRYFQTGELNTHLLCESEQLKDTTSMTFSDATLLQALDELMQGWV